jgi:uncharacterized membrane protein YsdA (DUF1294 family)
MYQQIILIVYAIYLAFMSVVSFFIFGNDKKKAESGKDRTKEKTLLFSAVFGGAIGAFIGRIIFHHKTYKKYFSIVIVLSLLLQLVVLGVLIYLFIK